MKKWHKLKDKKPKLDQVIVIKYRYHSEVYKFTFIASTREERSRSYIRSMCGEGARHIKWRKF
jgi:hypothetical protein